MEVILLIVISLILVVIIFIAIKKLIGSLEISSREYYLNKIKEYDEEVIKHVKYEKNDAILKEIEIEDKKDLEKEIDPALLKILNLTDYSDLKYYKLNRDINEKFSIDEKDIIQKFLNKHVINENSNIYQNILDKFSPNVVYKIKSMDKDKQVSYLKTLLSEDEKPILEDFASKGKFNFKKFVIYINNLSESNNNMVEVLVDDKNKNYDNLSPYIKTIYSKEIYKGLIIKYQNKLYDYSINERDVV